MLKNVKILLLSARYCYPMKLCVHCRVQAAIIGARLLLSLNRSGAHLEQVQAFLKGLLADMARRVKKISIAAEIFMSHRTIELWSFA